VKKISVVIALLLAGALPVYAQSSSGSTPAPTAPNSGAGVQGMPGNKSGPAVRTDRSTNQPTGTAGQDASKVPGTPGSKSGPAAKSPNSK
jgi:curli biogenesis system outer membrane secretion channel CsgG